MAVQAVALASRFAIFTDMLGTCNVVRNFNPQAAYPVALQADIAGRLLLTGEGSSRIFPAKNAIHYARKFGSSVDIYTEGGRQAAEHEISKTAILAASNSGKTAEIKALMSSGVPASAAKSGKPASYLFGLTAHADTPVANLGMGAHILGCGSEGATAATKSVVEQALFMRSVAEYLTKRDEIRAQQGALADNIHGILTADFDPQFARMVAGAKFVYFAGRNDGVAEELTLKANEIARKKSSYLEGTYVVHGVEETMDADELVVLIDPYQQELAKYREVLTDGVGIPVLAISSKETMFPTMVIPQVEGFDSYLQLVAGWRLLLDAAIVEGVNPDKPVRARKIGNAG